MSEQTERAERYFAIYDSSPASDIDMVAEYVKETSRDGGRTWEHPRPMTGEFLRLEITDARLAECAVEVADGVATIESPHPMGGLIRYTPRAAG